MTSPESVQTPYAETFIDGTESFSKIIPLNGISEIAGRVGGIKAALISNNARLYIMRSLRTAESDLDLNKLSIWTTILPDNPDYLLGVDPDHGWTVEKLRAGYAEIPSASITTQQLPLPRDDFAMDVFIPADADGWVGEIQMSIDVPSASLNNLYLGDAALTALPKDQWSTIHIPMPDNVRDVLLGDYPGIQFRTFVNSFVPGIKVSSLRMSGAYSQTTRATHQVVRTDIRTNPMFDFEDAQLWSGVFTENTEYSTSGVNAKRISSFGWIELLSPAFQTEDLPMTGSRLAVNFYPPSPAPNSHWKGDIQAFVTCPTANLHNAWIDWTTLEGLFPNEYNTIEFELPEHVRAVLDNIGHTCSFRFTINTAENEQAASFFVDEIGFVD